MRNSQTSQASKQSVNHQAEPKLKERMPEESGLFFEKLTWRKDENNREELRGDGK